MANKKAGIELAAEGASAYLGALTSASTATTAFGTATAAQAAKIETLNSKLTIQQKELGILQQAYAQTAAKGDTSSLSAQRQSLAIEKQGAAIQATEGKLKAEQSALDASAKAQQEAATSGEAAAKSEQDVGQQAAAAAPKVKGLSDTAEQAGSGFSALREVAVGALREVGAMAVSALAQAGQAVASFVGDSISLAGNFEAGMNQFGAAAGDALKDSGTSLDQFKQLFLSLGAELPVSTSEVQEAATTLVKGGLDPAILAAGGLKDSLLFAAAAGMDLNSAAELGVKTLGTFVPITASAAEQTAFLANAQNLMVKAAGASTLDVDKLGSAMLAAGGQAKAAGVDYQDFVTTMGLISPSFSSAETAGTSYKNFLARINPSTKPAIGAMIDLGLYTKETGSAFFDSTGKFVGNQKAAQLLQNALSGLSDEERIHALQTIFGNDAMGAAIALASAGADGYATFAKKMEQASGVQQQAAAVQQGWNIALDNAKGSVEALQIVVGSALLPVLTDLFNGVIAPAINTLTTFASAVMGSGDAFNQLSPALQGVARTVQYLGQVFDEAFASFQTDGLGAAISTFGAGIAQLSPMAGTIIQAFAPLGDFLQGNFIPILAGVAAVITGGVIVALGSLVVAVAPVIAVMAGAIAAGALLYAAWQSNFLNIQGIVAGMATVVLAVFGQVQTFLQAHGTEISQFLTTAWTQIGQIVTSTTALINATVIPGLTAVGTFITAHGAQIQAVLVASWQAVAITISGTLGAIQGVISATLAAINGDWSGAWALLQGAAQSGLQALLAPFTAFGPLVTSALTAALTPLGAAIGSAFSSAVASVSGFFSSWGSQIAAGWTVVTSAVVGAVQAMITGITSAISAAGAAITGAWNAIYGATIGAVTNLVTSTVAAFVQQNPEIVAKLNELSGSVTAIWNRIGELVNTALVAIISYVTTAWSQVASGTSAAWVIISSNVAAAWATVSAVTSAAVAAVAAVVTAGWTKVQAATTAAMTAIAGVVGPIWSSISSTISGIVAGIVSTIIGQFTTAKTGATTQMEGIATTISGMVSRFAAAAASVGKAIVDGIAGGIRSGASAIVNAALDAANSALNAAKSALGIHSPSAVASAQVGVPFVQGIVQGIMNSADLLKKAARTLSKQLTEEMKKVAEDAADAFTKALQSGLDANVAFKNTALSNLQKIQDVHGDTSGLKAEQDKLKQLQKELADLQNPDAATGGTVDTSKADADRAESLETFNRKTDREKEDFNKDQADAAQKLADIQVEAQQKIAEVQSTTNFDADYYDEQGKLVKGKLSQIADLQSSYADKIATAQSRVDDINLKHTRAVEDQMSDLQKINDAYTNATKPGGSSGGTDNSDAIAQKQAEIAAQQTTLAAEQAREEQRRQIAAFAQYQIAQEKIKADAISKVDAKAGAAYYALMSQQALDYADLRAQQADARAKGDGEASDAIEAQISLMLELQAAQKAQFAQQAKADSPYAQMITDLTDLQNKLQAEKDHDVYFRDMNDKNSNSLDERRRYAKIDAEVQQDQSALDSVTAQLAQLGSAAIDGIISGVQGQQTALDSSIVAALGLAQAQAEQALGIHSPSKVWAAALGVPSAQGISVGFVDAMAGVRKDMAAAVMPSLGSSLVQPAASAGQIASSSTTNNTTGMSIGTFNAPGGISRTEVIQVFNQLYAAAGGRADARRRMGG